MPQLEAALELAILPLLPPNTEFVRLQGRRLTLRMLAPMPTPERGHLLLEFERRLRREVDPKLEVFLEPKGDVNTLRVRLRGVKL